jgi:hypothetical protein
MSTLYKYPDDDRLYDFDFSLQAELVDGQTIASATVDQTVRSGGSGALTIGTPAISGGRVQVQITGGVEGSTYALTCEITTSSGSKIVGIGALHICDQPNA